MILLFSHTGREGVLDVSDSVPRVTSKGMIEVRGKFVEGLSIC